MKPSELKAYTIPLNFLKSLLLFGLVYNAYTSLQIRNMNTVG